MRNLFGRFLERYSIGVLAACFFLTLGLGMGMKHLELSRMIDPSTLPSSNEIVRSIKSVSDSFGDDTKRIIVSVEARNGTKITSAENLKLIGAITDSLSRVKTVKRKTIVSLTNVTDFQLKNDDLTSDPVVAGSLSQSALEKKIASNNFIYGRLISKDFKSALIIGAVYLDQELTQIHNEVFAALGPHLKERPNTIVTVLGDPEVNYQLNSSIEEDIVIFAIAALLLMLLCLYLVFRTWQGVAIPYTAILASIIWTMGIIGYYGEPVTLLSATLPVMLVVIGSSFSIHVYYNLLKETKKGRNCGEVFSAMLKKLFSPLILASMTTFIGAITLLAFKIRPMQHFGLFIALGTVLSVIAALLIIPCMYKHLARRIDRVGSGLEKGVKKARGLAKVSLRSIPIVGEMTDAVAESAEGAVKGAIKGFLKGLNPAQLLDTLLGSIARVSARYPMRILGVTAFLVALSVHYSTKIEIGFENLDFFPKSNPVRAAAIRLDQTFEGTNSFEIMLDTRRANGVLDPKFLAKLDRFETALGSRFHDVTHTFSINHLLKKIHSVMNPNSKTVLPETGDLTAQYFLLLGMSSSTNLDNLLTSDYSKVKLVATVDTKDTKRAEAIFLEIKEIGRGIFKGDTKLSVGGQQMSWVAIMRYLVFGKIQNMLLCMLLIFMLVMARYRSIVRGLITIIPLPIGVATNFGLMGFLGIRLDFITAIITSFAMGIGVDFSIHFIAALRAKYKKYRNMPVAIHKAIIGPGRAIVYNALVCLVGFGVLFLSQFSALNIFGVLICFNMVVLLLATFMVIPAVARIFHPEFITNICLIKSVRGRRMLFATKVAFSSFVILILSVGIFLAEAKSAVEAVNAEDLLKKSVKAAHNQAEESTYVMKLIGRDGKVGERKMKVWFKSESKGKNKDDVKLLIKFTEPANIRGTGFLSVIKSGADPRQWLYLPALRKTRKISGGNSNESFLGSDFTMGDISVDPHRKYEFKTKGKTKCGQSQCHVLEGKPKDSSDAYSKKVVHIRTDNFLNVYTEFYNQADQKEKVMTLQGVHQKKGKWWAKSVEMKNLLTSHRTVIEYVDRNTKKIPKNYVFTKNFLER